MADRPWRTDVAVMAVFVWSALLGVPVLVFHVSNIGLEVGQHLHAFVMFVASQFLVFWLAARWQPKARSKPPPQHPVPKVTKVTNPFVPSEPEIWNAELVPVAIAESLEPRRHSAKLIVGNYVASSRSRIVYIEPGGKQLNLQPGQEIQILAHTAAPLPTIRVVESDLATQVYVEGIETAIQVSETNGVDHEKSTIP